MKTKKLQFMMIFFLFMAFFSVACTTQQRVVPEKRPLPPQKVPELGAKSIPHSSSGVSSGVVFDLKKKAERQMAAGKTERAFSTLEEALRINPNDPAIWHMLAQIQLQKGNADQAEELARKSNLLAGGKKALRRQNWLIIAKALEQKGLTEKAAAARHRAKQ